MTEIMGLNIFDIVIIGLILLLSIKGLLNGFTKELFSAIGLIGGIFVASYFHKTVAEYIHSNITDALSINALNLISLIVIFVLFLTVVKYIGKGVALLGDSEYISATSRLGGMLIKIITLFFVFSLIVFAFSSKPQVAEKFKDTLDNSKLYPLLKSAGATILNMPIISDVNLGKKEIKKNESKESSKVESNSSNEKQTTEVKHESNNTEENATKVEENVTKAQVESRVEDTNTTSTKEEPKAEANSTKIDREKDASSETNSTSVEDNNSTADTNSTKK